MQLQTQIYCKRFKLSVGKAGDLRLGQFFVSSPCQRLAFSMNEALRQSVGRPSARLITERQEALIGPISFLGSTHSKIVLKIGSEPLSYR